LYFQWLKLLEIIIIEDMNKHIKFSTLFLSIFLFLAAIDASQSSELSKERITLNDLNQLKDISSIDVSHSANLMVYSVSSVDEKKDRYRNDIWLLDLNKNKEKILLKGNHWVGKTSFSPDDILLGYLAPGRGKYADYQQIWTINTKNLVKRQITRLKANINDFEWSPDGKKIILVAESKASDEKTKKTSIKTPEPIVIDRYHFKQDGNDFLGDERQHLYLLDINSRTTKQLTKGSSNEFLPSWSPDNKKIAYVTKTGDMDRTDNYDIYVLEIDSIEDPIQLTTAPGSDSANSRPQWSPDGKKIAYLYGDDSALLWYALTELAVIDLDTKINSILTKELDLNTASPQWSDDGQNIYFIIEDNMKSQLAKYSLKDQTISRITPPNYYISGWAKNYVVRNGKIGLILSNTNSPDEVFFYDEGNLSQQSHHNSELLSSRKILETETISFLATDGEELFGMMIKPDNFDPSKKYPLIIRMHGGPVSQYGLYFSYDWQLFAASDYVVMAINPRGSSGRGLDFQKVIFADWGNIDADDISELADYAISLGYIDENKLGLGGWSYGGMLTNYVIAKDQRFKAATSGAGIANILSGFGDDQYIREYIAEMGTPWDNTETWLRVSHPFLNANKIVTPTLFLVGEKDYNVPLIGSEQMYQALKHLNIPTELVVYPGEHHSFSTPSYNKDVLERYLAWYKKYLN
jgi:dipeptidyl aminopeptidase/acylaminoacyl peptidase|tara:strand:+ start:2531 stop:4606 length:2076 start_codon:yes stop_codon:yes gene_type:complete